MHVQIHAFTSGGRALADFDKRVQTEALQRLLVCGSVCPRIMCSPTSACAAFRCLDLLQLYNFLARTTSIHFFLPPAGVPMRNIAKLVDAARPTG